MISLDVTVNSTVHSNEYIKIIDNIQNNDNSKEKLTGNKGNIKDGGWGWVIVFASFLSNVLTGGIIYAYGVLAPEYIEYFVISRSVVGWLGSVLVAVTLGFGTFTSYLCRRFSYRKVSIVGSIISVIGFGAPYFYPKLWFLFVSSSIICGLGFSLAYVPSILIVNMWFEKKRSFAIGIAVCGTGFGTFVFSYFFQILLKTFNWKQTMLISGGTLLLLIPCSLTYSNFHDINHEKGKDYQSTKRDEANGNDKGRSSNEEDEEMNKSCIEIVDNLNNETSNEIEKLNSTSPYIEMMKNPIFILYLISTVLVSIGFNAPFMFAKDRAIQLGISANRGSFLISSIGIGNCFGRIGFGYLATMKVVNRFHLFNVSKIISGLVLIGSGLMNNYIFMIAYTMIYGMMTGAFVTLTSVILGDMFGTDRVDQTFGLSLFFQGISVLIGPPFAGFLYDTTKSFDISFGTCGLLTVVSGIMMYLAYISRDFRKKSFAE